MRTQTTIPMARYYIHTLVNCFHPTIKLIKCCLKVKKMIKAFYWLSLCKVARFTGSFKIANLTHIFLSGCIRTVQDCNVYS